MRTACLLTSVMLLSGCAAGLEAPSMGASSVEGVVVQLASWAEANDTAALKAYMDNPSIQTPADLAKMIRKSDIKNTYGKKLSTEGFSARLNYHDLAKGLHFQVDMDKRSDVWTVSRIWFCR